MTTNQQIVLEFIQACNSRDINKMMAMFDSTDCVFHNIPWEPLSGIEAIREFLQNMFNSSSEIDWQIHNIAETTTGTVLTERTDRFRFSGKPMEVPVMGAFDLRNGKITAWRDYFDTEQVKSQLPTEQDSA
ncbi:MAG: nuclear transport factor 2 family protein [Chloroflexi bacterium]|nr:nuclear transport factor 2 family protein [Chloroflexota bacterium]